MDANLACKARTHMQVELKERVGFWWPGVRLWIETVCFAKLHVAFREFRFKSFTLKSFAILALKYGSEINPVLAVINLISSGGFCFPVTQKVWACKKTVVKTKVGFEGLVKLYVSTWENTIWPLEFELKALL